MVRSPRTEDQTVTAHRLRSPRGLPAFGGARGDQGIEACPELVEGGERRRHVGYRTALVEVSPSRGYKM